MNKLEYLYLWIRKSPTFACGFIIGAIAVASKWITLDQEWLTTIGGPIAIMLLIASERASVKNVKVTKAKAVEEVLGEPDLKPDVH